MSYKNLRQFTAKVAGGVLAAAAVVTTILACSEITATGGDINAPTLVMASTSTTADTGLDFSATVTDNLGIKEIHIVATGGVTATLDSVFTTAVTQTTLTAHLSVPISVPPGTAVSVIGYAVDGAGNRSKPDTLRLAVGNLAPAKVVITSPASGTIAVQGKSIILATSATSPVKVTGIGYQTSGSFATKDSTVFSSPLSDSMAILDTLAIPQSASTGSLVVTPFVLDSLGQRTLGAPITLNIQSASATTTPPTVNFGTTPRIEVTDTLHVEATDPVGISYLGYEIRLAPSTTVTTPPAPTLTDSVLFNGDLISVPKRFNLALPSSIFNKFPDTIYVRAFARDANSPSIRGYAKLATGAVREDTIVVVAGVTRSLPNGGSVADALYHQAYDRLYLTNIDRNTVEVFNLADSSFKAAINVGSRPWGITAWPRDRMGTMGDTLLIANSGGTDISYVDLTLGTTGHEVSSIREQQFPGVLNTYPRYQLPNMIVSTVTTELSPTTGQPISTRHNYDFSDRPQYVAATCRPGIGNTCGDVILTYTTTPTPGQTEPFNQLNGSVRWENLSVMTTNSAVPDSIKSHFFFEHIINVYPQTDTLAITREDAVLPASSPEYAVDIVPPIQQLPPRFPGDSAHRFYSIAVNKATLGFRDTTYARNSGNFHRAVFGEGGPILGSRAVTYNDTTASVEFQRFTSAGDAIPFPVVDLGISNYFSISDYIGNTNQRVAGVATNFDGSLAAIRGDSTYLINSNLRLMGLMPTSASNSGIDFHPQNTQYGYGGPSASGLLFAASADASLEVWETCHYQRVAVVPIRDPIVGPIKAALRSNGKLIIFGVTAKGVVIVTLPNTFQASCP